MKMLIATAETTPNIAVVKYWGKENDEKNIPYFSSLSFTMDRQLLTRSTIAFSPEFKEDEAWLNGKKLDEKKLAEIQKSIKQLREKAKTSWKFKLVSKNFFPTAAGMASSASGFAALVLAADKALGTSEPKKELSKIARLISGSACRSLYGGFVEWQKGEKEDASDCFSYQIADEKHWPELVNIIAIIDTNEKKILSRAGMQITAKTSKLYPAHVNDNTRLVNEMKDAVLKRNFEKFGELTMQASNRLHSIMLDTYPPIKYLNDTSWEVIAKVHDLNDKKIIAAYTFDAGPNAHVYTLEKYKNEVKEMLSKIPGVQSTMECKVGGDPIFSNDHMIDENGKIKV